MPDLLPSNAYRPLSTSTQKTQVFVPPGASPAATPLQPDAPPPDQPTDPRWAVLSEWLIRHGSAWVRSDGLHRQVRQLLDPRERTSAIRQRVQKLAGAE